MPCPVCNGASARDLPYRGIHACEPLLVEAFRGRWVSRCSRCEHVFCDPPPDVALLDRYYAAPGPATQSTNQDLRARIRRSLVGRAMLRLRARLRLERWPLGLEQLATIERHIEPVSRTSWFDGARILEVGAGSAVFSRTVRARLGRRVSCDIAEPSTFHADIYRRHRLRQVATTLASVPSGPRYRVIHSAHFLEHLGDPQAAFDKIRGLLEPGGLVFTEVPNCEAPYWDVFRYPDPPHLQFFTPRSLRALAEACGFVVCSLETSGANIADDPGLLLTDSPEVIGEDEIDRLVAIRRQKLKRRPPTIASGPKENLRLVMRIA